MRIRRRTVSGEEEKNIITGLIISTEFCKKCLPILNPNLLRTDFVRRVAKWTLDHYQQFGEAPNKHIQDIFNSKKPKLKEAEAEIIEGFLSGLSDRYEDFNTDEFNADFIFSETLPYLNECSMDAMIKDARNKLDKGKIAEAGQAITTWASIATPEEIVKGFTLKELQNMELTKTPWLVEGVIPTGLTILAGKSRASKSYLVYNIAVDIALGRLALGSRKTIGRGPVLYLALDDSKNEIIRRAKQIADQGSKLLHVYPRGTWPKAKDGGLKMLDDWLQEHPKTKLVIIDLFESIRSRPKMQGYFYADDMAAIAPFRALVDKYETSMILTLHTVKGKALDIFDEIRDTTGLIGAVDTQAVLTKIDTGTADRVLYLRGKSIEDNAIALKLHNFRFRYLGKAEDYMRSKARQQIVDIVNNAEKTITRQEIVKERGNVKGTDVLIHKLVENGEIERVEYGVYASKGYTAGQLKKAMKSKLKKHKPL